PRAHREPGLRVPRDPSHRAAAARLVCVGRGHRNARLLAHRVVRGRALQPSMTLIERAAFAVAVVTMGVLLWAMDPAAVGRLVLGVGWGMILVLGQEMVAHVFNALGWRFAFAPSRGGALPLPELLKLRIAGDAVNYLTPSGTLAGEITRTAMLHD